MQLAIDDLLTNASEAEQFLKLLANRNRLMVLCSLQDEELCVSDLNERVPLSQSALSQHLAALRQAGILATRRDKQTIYYRIQDPRVAHMLGTLVDLFCPKDEKEQSK